MLRRPLLLSATVAMLVVSCGGDDTSAPMEFTIETAPAMPGAPATFTATGAAVDESMLCANGSSEHVQTLHADSGLPETADDPPREGEVLWVEFAFTCSDGSGDFVLRAEATVDSGELESVIQTGELSSAHPVSLLEGTGSYESIELEGSRQFKVVSPGGFEDGVVDVYTGTLTET